MKKTSDYCIWDTLQDLVYKGRRLPFANLQDLKEAVKNKWKEVTIETVQKSIAQWKKQLYAVRKQNGCTIEHVFTNRCDWISISYSETCWTYWLFWTFWTPNTLLHISQLKAYNVIISHTVHLRLLFKDVISSCLILLLSNTTSLQSWGRFYEPPGMQTSFTIHSQRLNKLNIVTSQ